MRTMHSVLIGLAAVSLVSCASMGGATHDTSTAPFAQEVRRATQRYQDVAAATAAGYALFLGCVSSPQGGAMGIQRPEALMYEPRNGKLELVGVEYIVIAAAWDAANKTPPTLMGQLFHHTPSPNRYGIPAFYALHVWAWKHNPHGMFVDWNPKVSCAEHTATR